MGLPLSPPVAPQLARPRASLPEADGWAYEPKLDGFRAVVFRDGDQPPLVQSRNGKDLTRYFPELEFPPGRWVADGELVIPRVGGGEQFDALQQRIHPARSRIDRLAAETPAVFMAFDLLAVGDDVLLERPWEERRAALEAIAFVHVPVVRTAAEAEPWLHGAEGVIAKDASAPYRPGERTGMVKVRRVRTLDAVVRGYRPGKHEGTVGSLILALYGPGGTLHEVGHTSGFRAHEKRALLEQLRPYETGRRGAGEPSRWQNERELEWIELRPELVVEVRYDHVSDGRIRHGTKLLRWRDDKPADACTLDQLAQ